MPTLATTSPIIAATLWLLVAFSVVTWTLVVVKATLQVWLARQNGRFQQAFWGASSLIEAAAATDAARGPLARLAAAGFASLRDAVHAASSSVASVRMCSSGPCATPCRGSSTGWRAA
jgi:biopolymer transport protein ExbB